MKKKDALHYIKVHCDFLLAVSLNDDLAFQGPHTLGKLFDHAGQMPSGSGFFHDVLSGRIDKMRRVHRDFRYSCSLLSRISKSQYWCVCAWELLIHKRPDGWHKVIRSGPDVAEYTRVDYEWLKKTRVRGIDAVNAQLGLLLA